MNDKKLNLSKVKILILDECDKMVEIGNKLNHEDVKFFIAQGNYDFENNAEDIRPHFHATGFFLTSTSGFEINFRFGMSL